MIWSTAMQGRRTTITNLSDHPLRKGVKRGQMSSHALHLLRWRGLRAQNLVEFALIFPVLMLLLIGMINFGRVFHVLIAISNSAREGVRYGSTYGMEDINPKDGVYEIKHDEIKSIVESESGGFLDQDKISVQSECVCREPVPDPCPSSSACISEGTLRVTVEYTTTLIFFPIEDMVLLRDMEMMIP